MAVGTTGRLLAAGTAAVIAVGVCAGDRGDAATGPATIRITDRQTSQHRFGSGVGARELDRFSLHSRTGHTIGSAYLLCDYFDRKTQMCRIVFTLPKGSLVAEGMLTSRLFFELAIVGGTDLYENARGTLTSTSLGLDPPHDLLLFRLVG